MLILFVHSTMWPWLRISAKAQIGLLVALFCLASSGVWADPGKPGRRQQQGEQLREREGILRPDVFVGPDLVMISVISIDSYGSMLDEDRGERISAFSTAGTTCNKGTAPAVWNANTNQHPVWAQNLYRLHDGRFEQVGMSWLLHGFFAVMGTQCGTCQEPGGQTGQYLGVNCSNPESAGIAGAQSGLTPRSIVDAFSGYFPYLYSGGLNGNLIDRRLQVKSSDLEPALSGNALYFAEVHVVSPDDAYWGNGGNNASYRPVSFVRPSASQCSNRDPVHDFCAVMTGATRPELPAIKTWKEYDPEVVETEVKIPGEGIFHLSARARPLAGGYWRYEYALYNMNSHRSGASFTVPIPAGAEVRNVGFHAPFYHSGEPFSNEPWDMELWSGALIWTTTHYVDDPNANALRWGTLYNFRFEADQPPAESLVEIGLFRPGVPAFVPASTIGPSGF